jgi:putative DNA methylase
MKKQIEVLLPLKEINKASIADNVKKGHPANLHLWWNRSQLKSSRASLHSALTQSNNNTIEENQKIIDEATVIRDAWVDFQTKLPPLERKVEV